MITRSVVQVNCSGDTFTLDQSGAIATHVAEAVSAARELGLDDPTIVSRRGSGTPRSDDRLLLVDPPLSGRSLAERATRRLLREAKPRTSAFHRLYARRVALALARAGVQPTHIVCHNDPEVATHLKKHHFPGAFVLHVFHSWHPASDWYKKQYRAVVDASAAVSTYTAQQMTADFRLRQVDTLYNGVNPAFLAVDSNEVEPVRVVFLGRRISIKGIDVLLAALAELEDMASQVQVHIIGSSHWNVQIPDAYQQLVDQQIDGLRRRGFAITEHGHVVHELLPAVLSGGGILVFPSRERIDPPWVEAFGLALVEGMAAGLATIASKSGGIPEVVGSAGWLVPTDEAGAVADALRRVIVDGDLRRTLSSAARERARGFSWHSTAMTYDRLLSSQAASSRG